MDKNNATKKQPWVPGGGTNQPYRARDAGRHPAPGAGPRPSPRRPGAEMTGSRASEQVGRDCGVSKRRHDVGSRSRQASRETQHAGLWVSSEQLGVRLSWMGRTRWPRLRWKQEDRRRDEPGRQSKETHNTKACCRKIMIMINDQNHLLFPVNRAFSNFIFSTLPFRTSLTHGGLSG